MKSVMWKNNVLVVGILAMMAFQNSVFAQDTEVSDEDLAKYAIVMKWAADEKKSMGTTYNGWIKEKKEMIKSAKFNELRNADKANTLAEAEATEEELAAFNEIQVKYKEMTTSFKEIYTGKIKEDIGAGLYNRLKKSLKTDTDMKVRYEAILAGLAAPAQEAPEASEG